MKEIVPFCSFNVVNMTWFVKSYDTNVFLLLCLWVWLNNFFLGCGVDPTSSTNFNKQFYSADSNVLHQVVYTITAQKF